MIRYLSALLLRQAGSNYKLVEDLKLLPEDSQERLFRILQLLEQERDAARSKLKRMPWIT